jgi:DnaJ-class molecular chaperone
MSYMEYVPCYRCNSTGYLFLGGSHLDEENYEECPDCNGLGEIEEEYDE